MELEERMNKVRLAMLRWEVDGRAGTLERATSWLFEIAEIEYELVEATMNRIKPSSRESGSPTKNS